jgi:SAM-dependent methyltransferase
MSFIKRLIATVHQHGLSVALYKIFWKLRDKKIYAPMLLAFKYCQGQGVELGAAAYNPFNLKKCINVAPFSEDPNDPQYEDFVLYRDWQIKVCGRYIAVDMPGDAINIPVPDHSQDYVLSSHVVEHLPNLVSAFQEWNRVLKPGGVVFMLFPKRDSLENDAKRPITPVQHFIDDYKTGQTIITHVIPEGDRIGGHYHVFTLASMIELVHWCNNNIDLGWQVEASEETDSKVGNGHTLVCRYVTRT